jgi:hypothetical protein
LLTRRKDAVTTNPYERHGPMESILLAKRF